MYVPNYIPDPIEVPQNVTEEPYRVRLGFVRRVALLHFLSILAIGGLSMFRLPSMPLMVNLAEIGLLILALSLIRITTRATKMDQILSLAISPVLLVSLGLAVRSLNAAGWPIWGVAVGSGAALIYSLSCGRDFSFVGQFFLSLIASTVILAVVATSLGMTSFQAAVLLSANAVYLFYLVYDSASLLARRRLGEEAAAVIDLYRDVFNFFGYVVRVARHWRRHRIWAR